MTMSDTLGDLLTRIRNGQQAGLEKVASPASKLRENVLNVLKEEGFIESFTRTDHGNGISELEVELKYYNGEPVIRKVQRVSKPGRRVYSKAKEIPQVYNGLGISILSTPRGVMSDHDARDQNVGGEVLCQVF